VIVTIPVDKITITPSEISVNVGQVYWLVAAVEPFNAANANLIWSSGATSVATVNQAGIVTGVSPGTVTITATASDGSGVVDSCTVTVK
jgi:uncharacterized protein YjdB